MASGIHTVSPQTNINLIHGASMYAHISQDSYNLNDFSCCNENRDYFHYNEIQNVYSLANRSNEEYSTNLLSQQKLIATNNNVLPLEGIHERCMGIKMCKCPHGSGSNESDISNISYSSIENPEIKGVLSKSNVPETRTAKNQNDAKKPCPFQPNLYQPNTNYRMQKNRYFFRGGRQTKFVKNSGETDRKVHGLMRRFQSRAYKMKIEPNPQSLFNGGPWDSLNQAVWDVLVNRIQKEETYVNKLNVWKTIFLFFKVCLDNYGLYLVGSTMSGFALEGSDIDICLLIKPFSNEPRVDSLHHLKYLQHVLLKNGLASEAELIMAKVPILKFKHKETGFDIDLNCNNVVGIQNTRLLYCYSQLDWRVRPLVVIIKIWAQSNNINDAKNMTISSYSWTLMVIHYLQCGVFPPVLPCLHSLYPEEFAALENRTMDVQGEIEGLKNYESENKRCLGDLLIGFFHYYSYFNYEQYAISVRTASQVPIELCKQVKSPKNDPHQWKFLCIEEPFDLSNTAKSVFDLEVFRHIKQVILTSYKELACNKTLNRILPLVHYNGQR